MAKKKEKKEDPERGQYVAQVRENTRRYVQDLLEENARLEKRVGELEDEQSGMKGRFDDMKIEQRRFFEDYVQVDTENNNLASLYVATYRLHGSLNRGEILSTIQEIVANLIGSEEMAVFELNADEAELNLLTSVGIKSEDFQTVSLGAGLIGEVARSGEPYVANGQAPEGALPQEATLTACAPLKVGGRVSGAVALFRLLDQKPGLEPLDLEIFDLLACQAGTALYCAKLHEQIHAKRSEA